MTEVITIGLDLAKSVFQVHGVDVAGKTVIRRQLRRRQVLPFFRKLPACLVGIDTVAGWFQDITGTPAAPVYFGGFVMLAAVPFLGLLRALQRQISPSEDPTSEKVV